MSLEENGLYADVLVSSTGPKIRRGKIFFSQPNYMRRVLKHVKVII